MRSSVLSPDVNELRVLADIRCSGSLFHSCGAQKPSAGSPHLVLILGAQSKPVPEDLRGLDAS